jgi:hypothetical protein
MKIQQFKKYLELDLADLKKCPICSLDFEFQNYNQYAFVIKCSNCFFGIYCTIFNELTNNVFSIKIIPYSIFVYDTDGENINDEILLGNKISREKYGIATDMSLQEIKKQIDNYNLLK